ncbi:MAG: GAF domain-containing protein, partial [Nevskia sp.]|nr:GAF domain-containing protein [Nevskia sp.]
MRPSNSIEVVPPSHVAESWRRCRGMGLHSGYNPQPNAVSRSEMRQLLERDQQLAQVAAGELRTLALAMADTGHVVILVDDQGRIVSAVGEAAAHGPVLRHARSGVDCSETRFGTNAAGTALVERRPVLVRHTEHFFEDLRHMDCLAAPIFRPCGGLIGVLDVSCETRPLVPGLMELVQSSVTRIERLLLRGLGSPYILRLHPHPGCIGTPFEALVALGEEGQVLGLNTFGARLLGVGQQQALHRPLRELLDTDLRRLERHVEAVALRAPGGMSVFATLAEAPDLEGRPGRAAPSVAPYCAVQQEPVLTEKLTRRELRILRQLDSGQSNREIAEALFISEGTLKWHLHNIYGKLGARSRAGALARARGQNLLDEKKPSFS